MSKKITPALILLYLLPWGIQCLINNFMPIYVASLPFSTEKTVGNVAAVGATVTMLSQYLWTKAADKAKSKSNVLSLSLILVCVFSLLFLIKGTNELMLYIFVFLFYSCYMTHQPLIDTIASENCLKTKYSFGFFRSFASFGYAVMGLLFMLLPNEKPQFFFIYTAALALISAVISKMTATKTLPEKEMKQKDKGIYNKSFVLFLVYTFFLFVCSSSLATFFPVYYTSESGIGGDIRIFSLAISISTFLEWGIMVAFSKFSEKLKASTIFLAVVIFGILRSGIIYFSSDKYIILASVIFHGMWFGFLWSAVTPYIKKIVPESSLASAQGIWTVVSSGIATFTGSFVGGIIAKHMGIRNLFIIITLVLVLLGIFTPFMIRKTKNTVLNED